MSRFKYYLWAAAGLLLLVGTLSVIGPKRALAVLGYTPVRDVDNPGRHPFQIRMFPIGNGNASTNFTVPAGKRLVIEDISVFVSIAPGSTPEVTVLTSVGGAEAFHFVPAAFAGALFSGDDSYDGHALARFYADPGSTVRADVHSNPGAASIQADMSVSGYLIDLP